MYRTINDFLQDWDAETRNTIKLFSCLTSSALTAKVDEKGRSLGAIAWHIVMSCDKMVSRTGLAPSIFTGKTEPLDDVDELITAYSEIASNIEAKIKSHLSDADLLKETEVFGQHWQLGFALSSLIRHNAYHKGQMSVLMRQSGLKVTGSYGPSREEWASSGITPPA